RHQLDRLLRAHPAWRALAAALVLEETHEVERYRFHVILVRQNDNRMRPDEAAMRLEGSEIERQIRHRRRQYSARGTTRQISLEAVAVEPAAAIFLYQLAPGHAGGREHHAGLVHPPGDRE